jgi:hypothetical protein
MIFQQSVFTLHGGVSLDENRAYGPAEEIGFPVQCSLTDLSRGLSTEEDFLLRITVNEPKKIREQLAYMGIHDGSLFPELDKQARYVEAFWTER